MKECYSFCGVEHLNGFIQNVKKEFQQFTSKSEPEDWKVYGNAGSDGRDQGTHWNAGFEWTSKDDEEENTFSG